MSKKADEAGVPTHRTYRRLLWALLIASVLGTALFAVRGIVQLVYWSDPAHQDQALEPWMPVGFVARSYGVEREALAASLGLDPEANRGLSLKELAKMRGQTFEETSREVEAAIQDIRSR
ncbi:hypothetical protein [Jannaschia seohaensis]|uniref:Uncharacterized protein n=1 Tax=Jannaschia seohaensis TaxID=475081 RepID=A0A2Y9AJG4_9RHOB|nr:hypothetical protein [Jannaschia seohaensis]PWJ20545.1 hypothetical protein BCF38_103364 [Jannaschia seohaensis]SSA44641.1 hypothetical protein SAMN05421539_103364 [Jannaschia seohaensis]